LINLLGFGISTLAPWLFGLVLDRGLGYLAGYLVLAAFGLAGVVGALFFRMPDREGVSGTRSAPRSAGARVVASTAEEESHD
jgi:hypothetical protein